MKEFTYTITDEVGIHARPAGLLAKEAKKFGSQIMIKKDERAVDATKLMAIMGLGIKCGQSITVTIDGVDEEQAFGSLQSFFRENL